MILYASVYFKSYHISKPYNITTFVYKNDLIVIIYLQKLCIIFKYS